jgi:hypothetical protein
MNLVQLSIGACAPITLAMLQFSQKEDANMVYEINYGVFAGAAPIEHAKQAARHSTSRFAWSRLDAESRSKLIEACLAGSNDNAAAIPAAL